MSLWERRPVLWLIAILGTGNAIVMWAAMVLVPVASLLIVGARHPAAGALLAAAYLTFCLAKLPRAPTGLKQAGLALEWLLGILLLFWLMLGFDIDMAEAFLRGVSHHTEVVALLVLTYVLAFLAIQPAASRLRKRWQERRDEEAWVRFKESGK